MRNDEPPATRPRHANQLDLLQKKHPQSGTKPVVIFPFKTEGHDRDEPRTVNLLWITMRLDNDPSSLIVGVVPHDEKARQWFRGIGLAPPAGWQDGVPEPDYFDGPAPDGGPLVDTEPLRHWGGRFMTTMKNAVRGLRPARKPNAAEAEHERIMSEVSALLGDNERLQH